MTTRTSRAAAAGLPPGAARPGLLSPAAGTGNPGGTSLESAVPPGSDGREPGAAGDVATRTSAALAAGLARPAAQGGTNPLAAAMSEDDLERGMRALLKDLGLRLAYHPWKYHSRRAKTGWPDWAIVGPGGLIFRELKRQDEKPTRAQQEWLDALSAAGADADTWRPSDLLSGRIARELCTLAGMHLPGGDSG